MIKIGRINYYLADELKELEPEYFSGCSCVRKIIKKKNIDTKNYAYAYLKDEEWTLTTNKYTKASLLLRKVWSNKHITKLKPRKLKPSIKDKGETRKSKSVKQKKTLKADKKDKIKKDTKKKTTKKNKKAKLTKKPKNLDSDEYKEAKKIGKDMYKKKTIPKNIKMLVWNKYIGEANGEGFCLCCKSTRIQQMSFHCGHIISEKNGGSMKVDNLKPICSLCNLSMGSTNMDIFIEEFGL